MTANGDTTGTTNTYIGSLCFIGSVDDGGKPPCAATAAAPVVNSIYEKQYK